MLPIWVGNSSSSVSNNNSVGNCWELLVMHGGVKIYRGHARGAREYLDQGCLRVGDYYLAEPEAFALRYTAEADGHVIELARMDGHGYEGWVAGVDHDTAEPRGRLRHDARAVRFVEVAVNGPKSWSLAAELHPDVAAAYDAAQDPPRSRSSAGSGNTPPLASGPAASRSPPKSRCWRR
jgi:TrwC relaxase